MRCRHLFVIGATVAMSLVTASYASAQGWYMNISSYEDAWVDESNIYFSVDFQDNSFGCDHDQYAWDMQISGPYSNNDGGSGMSGLMALTADDGDYDAYSSLSFECSCAGPISGVGGGTITWPVQIKTNYLTDGSYRGLSVCFWGEFACSGGTSPTCTSSWQTYPHLGSCPTYVAGKFPRVYKPFSGWVCSPQGYPASATGPGACT